MRSEVGPLEREPVHDLSPRPVSLACSLSDFEQVPLAPHPKTQRQCLTQEKGSRLVVLGPPLARAASGSISSSV